MKTSSSRNNDDNQSNRRFTQYYDLLEIPRTATSVEVKRAYRRRSLALHPDKGGNAEAFVAMTEAYEVLKDAHARRLYDAQLRMKETAAATEQSSSTYRDSSSSTRHHHHHHHARNTTTNTKSKTYPKPSASSSSSSSSHSSGYDSSDYTTSSSDAYSAEWYASYGRPSDRSSHTPPSSWGYRDDAPSRSFANSHAASDGASSSSSSQTKEAPAGPSRAYSAAWFAARQARPRHRTDDKAQDPSNNKKKSDSSSSSFAHETSRPERQSSRAGYHASSGTRSRTSWDDVPDKGFTDKSKRHTYSSSRTSRKDDTLNGSSHSTGFYSSSSARQQSTSSTYATTPDSDSFFNARRSTGSSGTDKSKTAFDERGNRTSETFKRSASSTGRPATTKTASRPKPPTTGSPYKSASSRASASVPSADSFKKTYSSSSSWGRAASGTTHASTSRSSPVRNGRRRVVYGLRKSDGQPCLRCLTQDRFCHQHTHQDPSNPQQYRPYTPPSRASVPFGVTQTGSACRRCARRGDYCYQHEHQRRPREYCAATAAATC